MHGGGLSNTPVLPVALAHVGLWAASGFTLHFGYVSNAWKPRGLVFPDFGKIRGDFPKAWESGYLTSDF
jgi:hypothetical protein